MACFLEVTSRFRPLSALWRGPRAQRCLLNGAPSHLMCRSPTVAISSTFSICSDAVGRGSRRFTVEAQGRKSAGSVTPRAPPFDVPAHAVPEFHQVLGALLSMSSECRGTDKTRGSSEYELDRGHIVDTLQNDYASFFERPLDFDIYHEGIVLEFGPPFASFPPLRGKANYRRTLGALQQGLASSTVRGGRMTCQVSDGAAFGHAVRVRWWCNGNFFDIPFCVEGISSYSLARQRTREVGVAHQLSYRVSRHAIQFVQFQPPNLRKLVHVWWKPQHVVPQTVCQSLCADPVHLEPSGVS
mmetsp:Transcript_8618/g.24015  ORF Transcript_8618/g.24015 Transcript_8618/m.24015 type:complete len:299 (-) Transcript_8618:71-967(-)